MEGVFKEKPALETDRMVEVPGDITVSIGTAALDTTDGFNGMVSSMGRTFAVFDAPVDDATAGDIAQTVVAAQAASLVVP